MDLREVKEFIKDMFSYIMIFFIVIFVMIYVIGLQQVIGPSMAPTLKDGNILLLNKAVYNFFDVKRFDIVSIKYDNTKFLVKRVIGLPGDKVRITDNDLYINGSLVEESYLEESVITTDFSLSDLGYDVIPEDKYFVLGDNRENSLDSRNESLGLIDKSDIDGKTILRLWPLLKIY